MATQAGGLQISPIRQELNVDPGGTVTGELVVANLTRQDLAITLFTREFSVANPEYDLTFELSHYDWIRIGQPSLTLHPQESRTVTYTLTPDKVASPGGYYFSIFASSNLESGGVDSTIQAATQLYTTVNGKLDRSTRLDNVSIPTLLVSPDITYGFTMTDTGNVYYTIYSIAKLSNIFTSTDGGTAAHLVLPGKQRALSGALPAPALPGVYTATIGYRTDSGNLATADKQVVYLPIWGIVVLIGVVVIGYRVVRIVLRRRRTR